jgi:hypothetical protein
MFSVIYVECRIQAFCAECHYAECRYAQCHYAQCHGALCKCCVNQAKDCANMEIF